MVFAKKVNKLKRFKESLEAFRNPGLRKEAEKAKLEAEEARMSYGLLEVSLSEEKQRHSNVIQDERNKYRAEITQLIENHRSELIQSNSKYREALNLFELEKEAMRIIKVEFEKLQKTHEESMIIIREENDVIREEIDEKNDKIKRLVYDNEKLRTDNDAKDVKLQHAYDEIARMKEEKEESFATPTDCNTSFKEVQSLRAVLDLKQTECADLRKALAESVQKAEQLRALEEKYAILQTKCEDLEVQLQRKTEVEVALYAENKKLQDTVKEEINHRKRLQQHNEELQYRLMQNKEVFKVLEGSDQSFSRSMITSSFNERHQSSTAMHASFERALSFRERKMSAKSNSSRKSRSSIEADLDDISPPSSPKVKGVVEKSDSVSYVLEMDESPEMVASRIVRRSFRNLTPPKNTPTKSPANKRPRKNSLMQSSSATSIVSTKDDVRQSRSASGQCGEDPEMFEWAANYSSTPMNKHRFDANQFCNGDYEEEDLEDFKLPALPSEIGRKSSIETLPVPKHLAGEAMISESNSEDESSSSSSSGQL